MDNAELKNIMANGLAWNGIAQAITRVFQLVVTVVLARLLTPEDFGIVGMAAIFIGFVAMLTELGLSSAIIQKKDIADNELSTAFWLSLIAGTLICIVSIMASPLIATFFGNEQLRAIVAISSLGLIVGSFGVTQKALLARDMNFKALAVINIGSSIIHGVVSISLALAFFGVWSLVAGGLALALSSTVLAWVVCKWRPKFKFELNGFSALLLFSAKVFGSSLVNNHRTNIDYLIIGKFLGAAPLGFYTIAFKLADFPRNRLSTIITNVAFPVFSSIQEENEIIRRGYIKVVRLISLLIFPMIFGLLIVASEFISIVYGSKWLPAVLPLQILLVMGAFAAISEPATTVLYSKGRPGLQFRLSLLYASTLTGLAFIAVPYGINAVAIAVLISAIIYVLPTLYYSNALIGNPSKNFLLALFPATAGTLAMVLVLTFYKYLQLHILNLTNVTWLLSAVAIGAAVYLLMLRAMRVAEIGEVLNFTWRMLRIYRAGRLQKQGVKSSKTMPKIDIIIDKTREAPD